MNVVSVVEGSRPIILAQPHGGTDVAAAIYDRLNEKGKALADTDWHINKLYDGLVEDITVVQSHIHRYVIDANRGPDDASLYPGQNTTGLCPLTDFNGNPIYLSGEEPDANEIEQRRILYHKPYHDALVQQISRLRQFHDAVIVYDCHSIRSHIPFLFEGKLPDFNIGTFNGRSCNNIIENKVVDICTQAQDYSTIVNGRFKGGWTTRHYGKPDSGVQAIQMELTQCTYMQETAPWPYDDRKSDHLRQILAAILNTLIND